jgi:hypothetical protein
MAVWGVNQFHRIQVFFSMELSEIPFIRLDSQHIAGNRFTSPKAIIEWMGAMQAQDFPMAKWGVGVRLPFSTEKMVASAIDQAAILRSHLLRPTWHFVAQEDIYWLLDLTAPHIKSGQKARDKDLELSEAVYLKSNGIIEKALSMRGPLSREDLVLELNQSGIATVQNRAAHLLMRAELEKIICSGATLRGKPTYALLAERVPKSTKKTREEALAELAKRYFTSRGPATLHDFSWWSGLPTQDARQALEMVKSDLITEVVDGTPYWMSPGHIEILPKRPSALLLPTYDEYILSYANRSAAISTECEQHMKEVSARGIFWPILVVNSQVAGTWKRTINKNQMQVVIQPFSSLEPSHAELIEQAAADFARFWAAKLDFKLNG